MSQAWVFGYGSLIWRPDFAFVERRPASVSGWSRRFWQGSHDHRGVPDAPGRVVTLVPKPHASCDGMAYLLATDVIEQVFEGLDFREKNGYERIDINLSFTTGGNAPGVVYIARKDNFAWLGEAPLADIAHQIISSQGPSGTNLDYLLKLAQSLRELELVDAHVFGIEQMVKQLLAR